MPTLRGSCTPLTAAAGAVAGAGVLGSIAANAFGAAGTVVLPVVGTVLGYVAGAVAGAVVGAVVGGIAGAVACPASGKGTTPRT